jgi:hypothetical protein
MNYKNAAWAIGLAAFFCAGIASAQSVQTEKAPQPDPGTTTQNNCISEDDHFKVVNGRPGFIISIENLCELRMRCKVFANVTTAKGGSLGHATLTLAPKSKGTAAKASHVMKIKDNNGNAISNRECRAL